MANLDRQVFRSVLLSLIMLLSVVAMGFGPVGGTTTDGIESTNDFAGGIADADDDGSSIDEGTNESDGDDGESDSGDADDDADGDDSDSGTDEPETHNESEDDGSDADDDGADIEDDNDDSGDDDSGIDDDTESNDSETDGSEADQESEDGDEEEDDETDSTTSDDGEAEDDTDSGDVDPNGANTSGPESTDVGEIQQLDDSEIIAVDNEATNVSEKKLRFNITIADEFESDISDITVEYDKEESGLLEEYAYSLDTSSFKLQNTEGNRYEATLDESSGTGEIAYQITVDTVLGNNEFSNITKNGSVVVTPEFDEWQDFVVMNTDEKRTPESLSKTEQVVLEESASTVADQGTQAALNSIASKTSLPVGGAVAAQVSKFAGLGVGILFSVPEANPPTGIDSRVFHENETIEPATGGITSDQTLRINESDEVGVAVNIREGVEVYDRLTVSIKQEGDPSTKTEVRDYEYIRSQGVNWDDNETVARPPGILLFQNPISTEAIETPQSGQTRDYVISVELLEEDFVVANDQFNVEIEGEAAPPTLPQFSTEITDVDGSAGGVERPRPVSAEVNIEADGEPYNEDISGDEFDVAVTGQTVDSEVVVTRDRPGIYTLQFVPPEQDNPGEYDLDVEFLGEASDTRSDAIRYSAGETTQIAASIQIDRSGSMRGIMDEAKRGAEAFVNSAGNEDYISLVSYSHSSRIDYGLKRQTAGNKSDLRDEIDALSPGGTTNIGDAIDDGFSTLEDAPEGAEKAGIHMTDGVRNTGPSESEILNEIVPKYNEDDVCLYTIGFTDFADEEFMEDVAEASDCGTYEFAAESGEADEAEATLQEVFSDIATDVSDDSLLYQESGTVTDTASNQFSVDDSVVRTSVSVQLDGIDLSGQASIQESAFHSGASSALQVSPSSDDPSVTLFDPDGNAVDPEANDDVERSVVGDTVTFQIDDPAPGEWSYEIENPSDEGVDYEAEVTGATQTTMDVSTAADTYYAGGETDLTATVIGPDGPLEGATVTADVDGPSDDDRTVTFTEQSPGLYAASIDIDPDADGPYTATVTADGVDVSRTVSTSWSVDDAPPLRLDQPAESSVVQGTSETFDVEIDRDFGGDTESITLDAASIETDDGGATLPDSAVGFETQVIDVDPDGTETVQATITVAENAVPGDYEGTVRAFREDGSVVTEPFAFTVLQDATFEPRVDETNDPVTAGEQLEIEASVQNTGEETATQTVELMNFDGDVISTESVSLAPGDETSVTLAASIEDAGSDAVTVRTDDGAVTATVEVLRTPEFTTDVADAPEELSTDDTLSVETNVSNVGEVDDAVTVELRLNGTVMNAETVTVAGGTTESITLTSELGPDDVGEDVPFTVDVTDDSESRTIDVMAAETGGSTGDGGGVGAGGSGGGGAGGGSTDDATTTPDPVVASVDASVSDAEPEQNGTAVEIPHPSVESITFADDNATGSVTVDVYDTVPDQAPELDGDRPFVAGYGVDVPDSQANRSATLELVVDVDDVSNSNTSADELIVLRAPDGATEYEALDTTADETNGTFVVAASTPGFSTFVVSADDDPETVDEEASTEDESEEADAPGEADAAEEGDAPEEEGADASEEEIRDEAPTEPEAPDEEPSGVSVPGFGFVATIVALLVASLLTWRRRSA